MRARAYRYGKGCVVGTALASLVAVPLAATADDASPAEVLRQLVDERAAFGIDSMAEYDRVLDHVRFRKA